MTRIINGLVALILLVGIICLLPAQAVMAAQSIVPPPNMVSWWTGDGNAQDFIGSNHGTLMNGAAFASGKAGQAFSLDGINDYINVGRTDFTNTLTIEAWVYPKSFGAYSTIYARWYDGTWPDRGVVFQIRSNSHLRLGVIDDSNILDGAYTFQANQWYHVAGVWDGSTSRVYVNGIEVGRRNTSGVFTNQNVDASIGRDPYPAQYYFNGLIDEVTIYDRALSPTEIQAIFAAGSDGKFKDKTPPTTEVSLSGTVGNDGWYRSDVQVILTSSDNPGGSGVKKTEYSFDGTNWNTYNGPFVVTGEGLTTFYYRSVDNAGNVEVESRIPGFHQVNMTGVFNSDAYTKYQNYEDPPNDGYYQVYPGTSYADSIYGAIPMDMKPKGTNNVWLSKGLERTVSFPTQLTLNMNVPNATNIWLVGFDGGWVFGGTQVDIRYTIDGVTRTATYYPNDWCWSGTGANLHLWVSGDHADIAVARIDLPAPGNVTNVTVIDVDGSAQASIPVFAVTVRYENPIFKSATVKIDKTAPILTFGAPTPAPNAAGWHNSDVSISFTAADALSGVASTSIPSPLVLTTEGDNVTGDVTVTDVAGNSATFTSPAVKIDKTAPHISATRATEPNAAGWNNTEVTVSFTATDTGSGVETCSAPITVSTEGANQFVTGTATDKAGNTASTTVSGISIDKTAPAIIITAPVTQEYSTGDTITINYAVADSLSGLESVIATLDGVPVSQGQTINLADKAGNHTFTVTCTDVAGNTATKSVSFSVTIAANIDITPDTVNPKSKGNPVTAYIEFAGGYDIGQIDVTTVKLKVNGTEITAQAKPTAVGDYDSDGIADLMVKFDREALLTALSGQSGDIALTISGLLTSGVEFTGTDTIRVLAK